MDGYISKPIRARELVELLEKYGRRALIPGPFERLPLPRVPCAIVMSRVMGKLADPLEADHGDRRASAGRAAT
jgi:hypothetical protein